MAGPESIRNIGIVAHINAGKTTLTERILYDTGKQRFMGEVDEGTATMDYLSEEQRRGISIAAAVTSVVWRDLRFNLIDTPGHIDFTAEVERSLRVLDAVVVVVDGVRGVESQTEAVWKQAARRGVPRLVFVNKLDRPTADFSKCLASLEQRLRCRPVPVVVPVLQDSEFCGLLDVLTGEQKAWRPGGQPVPTVEEARARAYEACAELDDAIMEAFVLERETDPARVRRALREGTMTGRIIPVLAGSALHNRGVDWLLDAIGHYLPSPADLPPVVSLEPGDGAPATRRPRTDEPMCGLVFRVFREDGALFLAVRLYSGQVRAGARVIARNLGAELAVVRVWRMHAEHREPLLSLGPGEIAVLEVQAVGVDGAGAPPTPPSIASGETLHAPGHPFRLEPLEFPEPVLSAAIEPRAADHRDAVEQAAAELAGEDPTLRVFRDLDTGALTVVGMGELHLEVFGSRLRERVGDRFRLGAPTVAVRETVRGPGEAQGAWHARGVRAEVTVRLEPAPGTGPAVVEDEGRGNVGGSARRDLLDALSARAASGLSHPWPAHDVRIRLVEAGGDGAPAEVEAALLMALGVAVRRAMVEAGSALLEPEMSFEVACPHDSLSAVLADLRGKAADIGQVTAHADASVVVGRVALEPMLGYSTRLRSLTRGLGTFQLSPAGFVLRGGA
jgi:elongation factor G